MEFPGRKNPSSNFASADTVVSVIVIDCPCDIGYVWMELSLLKLKTENTVAK